MKLGLQQRLYNAEVRTRRKAMGLTQRQLADRIGVTVAAVCAVERLRTVNAEKSETLKRLAKFFDVDAAVLAPAWLAEIEDVPKVVETEREVDLHLLRSMKQSTLRLERRKEEAFDMEWLSAEAPRILTWRERQVVFMRLGLDGSKLETLEAIATQIGLSSGRVSYIEKRARKKLSLAWAQHENE